MDGPVRWLGTLLAAAAVALTPVAGTLLAPGAARPQAPPPGTRAWRSDPRYLPDPVRARPSAVRRFFAGAPDGLGRQLIVRYPGVLGNLDGAQPAWRYAANRRRMLAAGAPYRRWATSGGQFLRFDPRGDGRIAEVFGDLDAAQRIAVLVPGVDSRAGNFVGGLGGRRYRAPAVQAANLYRAVRGAHPRVRVAVIAWLGYDTPDGVGRESARERLARAGAAALRRFVAGLVTLRPTALLTLLGHSYGSTVVGLAAPALPHQVVDIVALGSPGMGVDRAADLGGTARTWAGEAPGDWIRWVPGVRLLGLGHGLRPAAPAFGARPIDTTGVTDHDHYLSPGTGSLAQVADIVAGVPSVGRGRS